MIFGFTGARNIADTEQEPVVEFLHSLPPAEAYVTGGALGMDAFIGVFFVRFQPQARHVIIVPDNKSAVFEWWESSLLSLHSADVRRMAPGTTYKDRNQAIVDACDELVGFPEYPEDDERSRRSGSWQTIRMARKAGKLGNPEKIHILRSSS